MYDSASFYLDKPQNMNGWKNYLPFTNESHFDVMFVSAMIFSKKWVIFQKTFSIKLSYFSLFGSNLKWVEKQSYNFLCLVCCEIELFFKKKKKKFINGKQSPKISHTFYGDQK